MARLETVHKQQFGELFKSIHSMGRLWYHVSDADIVVESLQQETEHSGHCGLTGFCGQKDSLSSQKFKV